MIQLIIKMMVKIGEVAKGGSPKREEVAEEPT
jgi:hypothetical protein